MAQAHQPDALHELTLAEAADLIARRALSPVEYTQALLDQIAQLDDTLHAFITVTGGQALAQARAAEAKIGRGGYRGPLHGIPHALKDLIDTAGILTTGNSRTLEHNVPATDATLVARLAEAGAVLLGKNTAHEFAHGGPSFDLPWPPARNPWNPAHFTGGSSTGSAAAVAAGCVPLAIGSDTGGSIRTPASYCGLTGLKPTYGLVSRAGAMPHSFSLDYCGPLARTAEDCAIALQAIAGPDPRDPSTAQRAVPDYRAALAGSVKGLRIGLLRHVWEEDNPAGAELRAAVEEAIGVLQSLGAQVEVARMEPAQIYSDVKAVICEVECFAVQRATLARRLTDYGADYLGQVLLALLISPQDYVRAQRHRRVLVERMQPLYGRFDVLLTAGLGPAPTLQAQAGRSAAARWGQASATTSFNVTGGPALMLCCGFSESGLPMGLQLAGRPFEEATVLRLAHAYQQATGWHRRRPVLTPGMQAPEVQVPGLPLPPAEAKAVDAVRLLAQGAGLTLTDEWAQRVAAAWPVVRQVCGRIPDHGFEVEPAGVFRLDGK